MQEPGIAEQLSQNITRQGLTNTTLNFLRVSAAVFFLLFADWFPAHCVNIQYWTVWSSLGICSSP